MSVTRKGQMTRMRILSTAKEMYYEYGFRNTTIQKIADSANSTLGSMTYHFATKAEFVGTIFRDYRDKIVELANTMPKNANSNKVLRKEIAMNYIYLFLIFSDDKVAQFYDDVVSVDEFYTVVHNIYFNTFHSHTGTMDSEDRKILEYSNFGAHRSLMINALRDKVMMSLDELLDSVILTEFLAEGIAREEIERYLKDAHRFCKNNEEKLAEVKVIP